MLSRSSLPDVLIILGVLILNPSAAHADGSWSAYGECLMQDSNVGSCMGKQLLLDVSPVGEAVDDVTNTVQSGIEGAKESVRQGIGPGVYDSADDVREAGSLLDRILGGATGLLREEMSGNTSAEEIDRKLDGSLYDWFKDSATTADDVGGTGALSSLFGIGDKAEEMYENLKDRVDGLVESVDEFKQGVLDLGQSAGDELGSLVGWDDAAGEPVSTEPDVAFGTTNEERAAAAEPDWESAEPEVLASAHSEEQLGVIDEYHSDEVDAEAGSAAAEGASPSDNGGGVLGQQGTSPEGSANRIGAIDIDEYESTGVEELNRRWDADNRRILNEIGGVEVGVVRLEDAQPEAVPQEPPTSLDQRMVDFAMADGERSRAINANREEAEFARLALSSASLDRAFQQPSAAWNYQPMQQRPSAPRARPVSTAASAACRPGRPTSSG